MDPSAKQETEQVKTATGPPAVHLHPDQVKESAHKAFAPYFDSYGNLYSQYTQSVSVVSTLQAEVVELQEASKQLKRSQVALGETKDKLQQEVDTLKGVDKKSQNTIGSLEGSLAGAKSLVLRGHTIIQELEEKANCSENNIRNLEDRPRSSQAEIE